MRAVPAAVVQSQNVPMAPVLDMTPHEAGKPKIHSVRRNLTNMGLGKDILSRLETSSGPIKMTEADLSGALGAGASSTGLEILAFEPL